VRVRSSTRTPRTNPRHQATFDTYRQAAIVVLAVDLDDPIIMSLPHLRALIPRLIDAGTHAFQDAPVIWL
jgi:hypothetical protein